MQVATMADLKKAVQAGEAEIVVTDEALARRVRMSRFSPLRSRAFCRKARACPSWRAGCSNTAKKITGILRATPPPYSTR